MDTQAQQLQRPENLLPNGTKVEYGCAPTYIGYVMANRMKQGVLHYLIKQSYFFNHPEMLGMTEEIPFNFVFCLDNK